MRALDRCELTMELEHRVFEFTGSDFDESGVIWWIGSHRGTKEWQNPALVHEKNIRGLDLPPANKVAIHSNVVVEAGSTAGFLDREGCDNFTSTGDSPAITVVLPFAIHPTHYSVRHGWANSFGSMRNWQLRGSLDGESYHLLREHIDDHSLDGTYDTHTWALAVADDSMFTHFQLLVTGPNSIGDTSLWCSGIEFYGSSICKQMENEQASGNNVHNSNVEAPTERLVEFKDGAAYNPKKPSVESVPRESSLVSFWRLQLEDLVGRMTLKSPLQSASVTSQAGKHDEDAVGKCDSVHVEHSDGNHFSVDEPHQELPPLPKGRSSLVERAHALRTWISSAQDTVAHAQSKMEQEIAQSTSPHRMKILRHDRDREVAVSAVCRELDTKIYDAKNKRTRTIQRIHINNASAFNRVTSLVTIAKKEVAVIGRIQSFWSWCFPETLYYPGSSRLSPGNPQHPIDTAPDEFKCSLSGKLMTDPVIAECGHSFDRKRLEAALQRYRRCPYCESNIPGAVIPNHALRALIESWKAEHSC